MTIGIRAFDVSLLPPVGELKGNDLTVLREQLGVSQRLFAILFNVSVHTVRTWQKNPDKKVSGTVALIASQLERYGLDGFLEKEMLATGNPQIEAVLIAMLSNMKKPSRGRGMLVSDEDIERAKWVLGQKNCTFQPQDGFENNLEKKSMFQAYSDIEKLLIKAGSHDAAVLVKKQSEQLFLLNQ